jgi:opacity protein-like surface antigen
MKQFTKFGLLSSLLFGITSSYAVNPVQGLYLGLIGEMSKGPSTHEEVFIESGAIFTGTVNNNPIGGGGGLVLGYRYNQFRIEAEGLYNLIGSDTMAISNCTLQSPTVLTPTPYDSSICSQDNFYENRLGFNGSVSVIYGLINVVYDIIDYESDKNIFPYVGAGIGFASLKNQVNFVQTVIPPNNSPNSHGTSTLFSSTAAQAILGVGYFMDDYTWAGIDYRYLTINTLENYGNSRYAINSINFNVNLSFDKGST